MPGIKDVAKKAGVSVTTVSRVINNRGYISKKTRKKVEDTMHDMDYQPNQIARALLKNQTYLIGVIVPDSNHPFFAELVKYIEEYASRFNYKILICNSLENYENETRYISMLRQNRVDGIIMCSHTLDIDEYKKARLPIVSFDRVISNEIPYVASDNFEGGKMATEYLIKKGCKSLMHISGYLKFDCLSNRRKDAFKLTCMEHNIPYKIIEEDHNKMNFDYYEKFISSEVSKYIKDVDGVFCSNDIVAYALYLYAVKQGINVPKDLKIIGYDNHSFTRMLKTPRLSTISQPIEKIGKALSSSIIKLIESGDKRNINNVTLDVELIEGETT